jgi:hypothetical protein
VRLLRRIRRCLQMPGPWSASGALQRQTEAFATARVIVRCYYAGFLFLAVLLLPDWSGMLERRNAILLWPVTWLQWMDWRAGIGTILVLYVIGALLAAIWPARRWARFAAFLGMFEYVAFINSFGKTGHSLYIWMLTSFLLVFLPTDWKNGRTPSRCVRQRFLLVFWGCQAFVLMVYSMSGLGKVGGAIYQLLAGQINFVGPGGLASLIAERLLRTHSQSFLGPWFIDHPALGYPLMLGVMYLQLFSFWVTFRPNAQKFWATGLILFHIGSFFILTVSFPQNVFLLALLFLHSPWETPECPWQRRLAEFPIIGWLVRFCPSKRP